MRTRTNVYFGQGAERAVNSIKNLYPAGPIRVIAEEAAEWDFFAELLTDNGYLV